MPPNSVAVDDVDLAEAAAEMPDQRAGEGDDAAGDAAAHHQVAGIDEEGDRHQRKDAHAGIQPLEHDQRRQAHIEHGGEAGDAEAERDRRADEHQQREDAEEDPEFHGAQAFTFAVSSSTATSVGGISSSASSIGAPDRRSTMRSSENRQISTPPATSGR